MIHIAVLLIALGAAVGLYMAVQHFRGRTPPRGVVAATHGLLAVTGVIVLLLVSRESGMREIGLWALCLFAVAALGGLFLATQHMDRKRLSSPVIVIHALVAVVAFLMTLTVAYLGP